jgi:hypothetical protein
LISVSERLVSNPVFITACAIPVGKDIEEYPPAVRPVALKYFKARCEDDVADQLRKGGINPEEINTVILRYPLRNTLHDFAPLTNYSVFHIATSIGITPAILVIFPKLKS